MQNHRYGMFTTMLTCMGMSVLFIILLCAEYRLCAHVSADSKTRPQKLTEARADARGCVVVMDSSCHKIITQNTAWPTSEE